MNGLISVIIPVYNGDRYLAEAIDSVLAQTHPPMEIIVVDDGSTDNTATVAQRYAASSVKYHYQANQGISATRNMGVSLAQGDVLAFLDADDLWVPGKLEQQMQVLTASDELEAVYGHTQAFYSPELELHIRGSIACPPVSGESYLSSAMLIKRDAFLRVGLFQTHWQAGTDMSWYLHAIDQDLRFQMLPNVVHLRRLHNRNHGIINRHHFKQRFHILKEHLDRQRQKHQEIG